MKAFKLVAKDSFTVIYADDFCDDELSTIKRFISLIESASGDNLNIEVVDV